MADAAPVPPPPLPEPAGMGEGGGMDITITFPVSLGRSFVDLDDAQLIVETRVMLIDVVMQFMSQHPDAVLSDIPGVDVKLTRP